MAVAEEFCAISEDADKVMLATVRIAESALKEVFFICAYFVQHRNLHPVAATVNPQLDVTFWYFPVKKQAAPGLSQPHIILEGNSWLCHSHES